MLFEVRLCVGVFFRFWIRFVLVDGILMVCGCMISFSVFV